MCGITTILSSRPEDQARLEPMTSLLSHRGPDAEGFWRSDGVGLGHRRLAILDLSPAGAQPMSNETGSLHLVCNGEIYDYQAHNSVLAGKGHHIRSRSDCETLVHLYEEHGEGLLERINGMFAMALWDQTEKRLLAAVDRFGKKPLYYACLGDRLILASELKSLLIFPWVTREPDPEAVDRYLTLRYVPAPMTILKSVRKLEPSSMLEWHDGQIRVRDYWKPTPFASGSYGSSQVDDFQELLTDAVRLRLQSDVPLGIYLSGGVDSSAVAAVMAGMTPGEKVSYSVGFDYAHNELPRASRIAAHLGFSFNPVTVGAQDFGLIPKAVYHLDEPFGDLLALPAYLLARKAKESLTVVLTGDGADEILSGYFHQRLMLLRKRFSALWSAPGTGPFLSTLLRAVPPALLDRFFDYPDRLGPREKEKLAQALSGISHLGTFYEGITSCFSRQDKLAALAPAWSNRGESLAECVDRDMARYEGFSFLSKLSLLDLKYWIPFSVLFRLDKMNMAHAVETRSPFLDYRLVEMALNLPDEAKRSTSRNKEILRAVIDRLFPPELREKGKQAFYMPMTQVYRETYLAWVGDMLAPDAVARRGIFRDSYVREQLGHFRTGSMLAGRQLTAMAMLEQWFRVFVDSRGSESGES